MRCGFCVGGALTGGWWPSVIGRRTLRLLANGADDALHLYSGQGALADAVLGKTLRRFSRDFRPSALADAQNKGVRRRSVAETASMRSKAFFKELESICCKDALPSAGILRLFTAWICS